MVFKDSLVYSLILQRTASESHLISFWLLDPAAIFRPLALRLRSIVLLSGTLTPFKATISELGYVFEHMLVAPPIIRPEQIYIAGIRRGHLSVELRGTHQTTETSAYVGQIEKIIVDISSSIEAYGGTLVFVPNYALVSKLSSCIKNSIAEPKGGGSAALEKALKSYRSRILQKRPAVMLCVYRGKISEGVDFRDEYARVVIAVGIPYPSTVDRLVSMKKDYNDQNKRTFTGRQWYVSQAYRALNQALGRVIRHKDDWGSIFLLDSRLSTPESLKMISSWASSKVHKYDRYTDTTEDFKTFIKGREMSDLSRNSNSSITSIDSGGEE
jgi:regulator of telomere elongation helicase 1